MGKRLTATVLLALILWPIATRYTQAAEKPTLSTGRIAGEVLAGGAGGYAGMVAFGLAGGCVGGCALVGYLLVSGRRDYGIIELYKDLASFKIPLSISFLTIYTLGSAGGVYMVGNMGDETGSFLPTFGGSVLGLVLGAASFAGGMIAAEAIMGEVPDGLMEGMAYTTATLAPSIGATIAFNLTRRYKSSATSDDQVSRAAPSIYLNLLRAGF